MTKPKQHEDDIIIQIIVIISILITTYWMQSNVLSL
jgi:hypothetical protein